MNAGVIEKPELEFRGVTNQTFTFGPKEDAGAIDTATVAADEAGVGTVQFWQDTPQESREIVVTTKTTSIIILDTQEQANADYFILLSGIRTDEGLKFKDLTLRFSLLAGVVTVLG